jgi:hypothetical protein
MLYVKLHDDPSIVNSVVFPPEPLPPSAGATSAASQKIPAPSTNPPATDTHASTSSGTSSVPNVATHDAVVPPLRKPSAAGGAEPVPASNKSTPPAAPTTAPPAAAQTPQSVGGSALPGPSSRQPSTDGQTPSSEQPMPHGSSSTSGASGHYWIEGSDAFRESDVGDRMMS